MRHRLPTPLLTSVAHGSRVATYADITGASRAVQHLRRRGFDAGDIVVRPRELQVRPAALELVADEPRRSVSVIAAASAALVGSAWGGWTAAAVLGSALVGLVVGVLAYAADDLALRWRRRRAARAGSLLEARRFEVRVASDAVNAERVLAQWSHPGARPVRPAPGSWRKDAANIGRPRPGPIATRRPAPVRARTTTAPPRSVRRAVERRVS